MVLHLNKLESPSPKYICFAPSLVETGPVVLKKRIFNFVNVFSLFRNYLFLEKGGALHLKNLNTHHPRILCAKFG